MIGLLILIVNDFLVILFIFVYCDIYFEYIKYSEPFQLLLIPENEIVDEKDWIVIEKEKMYYVVDKNKNIMKDEHRKKYIIEFEISDMGAYKNLISYYRR